MPKMFLTISAGILAALGATTVPLVAADEATPLLLILDRDALDHGPPPHPIPGEAVNDLIASVGVRDQLPFFANNVGAPLTLLGGQNGSDGWFGPRTTPQLWASDPSANDGLQNFVLAGPGLGSPDRNGDRESLLRSGLDVTSIRGDGLRTLVGRVACAVVYDNDLPLGDGSAVTNLTGPNLGIIAFEVLAVDNIDGSEWPKVEVQILDARETCGKPLLPLPPGSE
ncbi:MAG TPA: hypothetical protein VM032_14975 [Vicinamibacterales bacterium]|nr:hypothetical protein [Vicinamibacterales bacterium]